MFKRPIFESFSRNRNCFQWSSKEIDFLHFNEIGSLGFV
ncbi:hypothetical protein M5D96_010797 [Drosophila gunungcola]|uniref:Uncharacterized protein n=1 Tax=Drosophila gunungcola TaxID=103775 RepID=A0A9P9YGD0_9MUSC|nr:hypothetical protein M5D96_010797 [Drosophila gunungcola]